MNLFITSLKPKVAVQSLDDTRLRGALKDLPVLFDSALQLHGAPSLYKYKRKRLENSPILSWLSHSQQNFSWAAAYFFAGLSEHKFRFSEPHQNADKVQTILRYSHLIESSSFTKPPRIVRQTYRSDGLVDAYRQHLAWKWAAGCSQGRGKTTPVWTKRQPPLWLGVYLHRFPALSKVV